MMKVPSRVLQHYGFVIALLAFAYMAYSDYSRDGDLVNLGFSVVLAVLAILATYFYSFHKGIEDQNE
jgi:hypothetical protein